MKKILVLILVCAMVLSLCACGKKQEAPAAQTAEPAPAEVKTEEVKPAEVKSDAAANIDPTDINMGVTEPGDPWYVDGSKDNGYFYLTNADNSVSGIALTKVENGSPVKTWLCTVSTDKHLIDQEAEQGKSEIDIVFTDDFNAYDNVSGTRYVRGNPDEIAKVFVGKQLVDKDDSTKTIIFNADGTGKEVFEGKEDSFTWAVDSAASVKYLDSDHQHTLTIVTDANGNLVSMDEQNFRSFVPAA